MFFQRTIMHVQYLSIQLTFAALMMQNMTHDLVGLAVYYKATQSTQALITKDKPYKPTRLT